jgi:hypothetical protein
VDDLRVQVRRRLEEATTELQQRLGEMAPDLPESFISDAHIQRITEEVAGPGPEAVEEARAAGEAAGRAGAHGALRAALADLDRARSQADVLGALLSASHHYAQRAAILLLRDGKLSGWGARGFESDDDACGPFPWAVTRSRGRSWRRGARHGRCRRRAPPGW